MSTPMEQQPLQLHPDRALPADPTVRKIARRIYNSVADLPLVCMHGHVDAEVFLVDEAYRDPAHLLVIPDHYVRRMLVSQGATNAELGVPTLDATPYESDPRAVFRRFCQHWRLFRGTPSRFWLEHELVEVLGVDVVPSAETADFIYDTITARLDEPDLRPRAMLDRFRIELISSTDPAESTLRAHSRLACEGYGHRIIPTFRPDGAIHIDQPGWAAHVASLGAVTDLDTTCYSQYLDALRLQRQRFAEAGALATDHGHVTPHAEQLPEAEAARIFAAAHTGTATSHEAAAFDAHMLFEMALMAMDDGLVMQIHPGVARNHSATQLKRFGADQGFDIPIATEYTRALQPLLSAHGTDPRLRLILFTVDESTFSRELAPLAGAYPSVRLGAPWWFLDSPEAMRRYRESVTETAGFYNTSGFVDDTRAFLSIPARHDLNRRIDAGYLALLVAEHRLGEDEAVETAADLAYHLPKLAYALLP